MVPYLYSYIVYLVLILSCSGIQVTTPSGPKLAACDSEREGAKQMSNLDMKNVHPPLLRYHHLCVKKENKVNKGKSDKKIGRFKRLMLSDSERRKMTGDDSDDDYSEEHYIDYLKKVRNEK